MKKLYSLFLALLFIIPCIYLSGCEDNLLNHNIAVASYNINEGFVLGDGIYKTNSTVTLTAQANNNFKFKYWVKNGIVLVEEDTVKGAEDVYTATTPESSANVTSCTLSFVANSKTEGKYIAVFVPISNPSTINYFFLESVTSSNNIDSISLKLGDERSPELIEVASAVDNNTVVLTKIFCITLYDFIENAENISFTSLYIDIIANNASLKTRRDVYNKISSSADDNNKESIKVALGTNELTLNFQRIGTETTGVTG